MKRIFFLWCMLAAVSNLYGAGVASIRVSSLPHIHVEHFRPEHAQAAYDMIADVAFEVSLVPGTRDDMQEWLARTGELNDLYNVDDVYFNNGGMLLVLLDGDTVVGTGGIKRIDDETCELKRMFFVQQIRGKGLGRQVITFLIAAAQELGYKRMRLDVYNPATQARAVTLYKKIGFYEVERFNSSGAQLFMEKKLTDARTEINEFSFMLKVSPGKGIGVFAAHDIPEGSVITFFPKGHRRMRGCDVPEDFLKYCAAESADTWLCPHDFSRMEIGWYLNHSDSPNLKLLTLEKYVTTRFVRSGEELTMDYNELGEPEEVKKDYYRK